jgi:integrase/recombinase XerD
MRSKGRKHRVTPLIPVTVATIKVWLAERAGEDTDPLFPTRQGRRLSHDALERRIAQHAATAQQTCPSLQSKRVTMHVLRHTAAMMLLSAGIDTTTIALWLGHEQERTTRVYLHADLGFKQRVLDQATPPNGRPGRYRAPDRLLRFLDSL